MLPVYIAEYSQNDSESEDNKSWLGEINKLKWSFIEAALYLGAESQSSQEERREETSSSDMETSTVTQGATLPND